jgi:hypothetical protein
VAGHTGLSAIIGIGNGGQHAIEVPMGGLR